MGISKRIKKYAEENFNEVLHTTLNPNGPGAVRIHLVPPKYKEGEYTSVAIINGQDIIPVNSSWTILLAEFIKEVNKFSGRAVSDEEIDQIMNNTCKNAKKVFWFVGNKRLKNDIYRIMNTFKQVAYNEPVDEQIDYINIGDYAHLMKAPHRMDIMVSSMVKDGIWHCNQKCVHCYAAGQQQAEEAELSTEQWKQIIDKLRMAGIPQVTFTGGEPTMREDLVELIDYSQWFVTRLNTNGVKLTKDLCDKLYAASLDSMQITFYSADEAIHNELVGANQYENTVKGIENAISAGINISINTPLCTKNKDYVDTLKFLKEKGVCYVTCSGLITTGNALNDNSISLQLSSEEIKEILKKAAEYCAENGMEISFTSPGWIEESFFNEIGIKAPTCGACLSNMAVTPGGNVVPCQSWLSGESLGNMLRDDFEKIWNSELCKERRDYSALNTGLCPLRKR